MLYNLHELNRTTLAPLSVASGWVAEALTSPFLPYSYFPGSRRLAARFDLFHRLGREYRKPEWRIDEVEINGQAVTVNVETVLMKPFCHLLHFKRSATANPEGDPTVLIVAPYSGHHATLLRDTVRQMLTGFDVYVTDWLDARNVPLSQGSFNLDDYVAYLIDFLHALKTPVHVMAVCQPAVPVMGAVALMSAQRDSLVPLSMTLMGGPIDTRESPTIVNELADRPYSWFETRMIQRVPVRYPGHGRLVYPGFVQLMGFVAMNPRHHVKSHYDYYLDLMRGNEPEAERHRTFYDEYNAVCDLPAEFYLQTIQTVFQDHCLANGTWQVKGELVRPEAITDCALLTIEGELDDITGLGQTAAAHQLTPNIAEDKKQQFVAQGSGHYGIFSGRRWRTNVYPVVAEFIHRIQQQAIDAKEAKLKAKLEAKLRREHEAKLKAEAEARAQAAEEAAKEAERQRVLEREQAVERAKLEAAEQAAAEEKLLAAAEEKLLAALEAAQARATNTTSKADSEAPSKAAPTATSNAPTKATGKTARKATGKTARKATGKAQ